MNSQTDPTQTTSFITPPSRPWHQKLYACLPALFVVYALLDYFIPIFAEGKHPDWLYLAIYTGLLAGQGVFLITWAVLGPLRLWVRWLLILAIGYILFFTCCFGIMTAIGVMSYWHELQGPAAFSLISPFCFLIVQIPLWSRRRVSGWRIVAAEKAATCSATEARQYGIAHLLILTAYVGVSLSLVQVGIANFGSLRGTEVPVPYFLWAMIASISAIFCLYVAFWAGPAVRACFLARNKIRGCLMMAAVWGFVSLLTYGSCSLTGQNLGCASRLELASCIFTHFACLLLILLPSLYSLRACGYVLIRAEKR